MLKSIEVKSVMAAADDSYIITLSVYDRRAGKARPHLGRELMASLDPAIAGISFARLRGPSSLYLDLSWYVF